MKVLIGGYDDGPRRRRGRSDRKRLRAKKKRLDNSVGMIALICIAVGGVAGGWGGAAIGFLIAGLLCWWLTEGSI